MPAQATTRFIPVDRFGVSGHLWPSDKHELRYLLRKRKQNGLEVAIVKIGRRLLIDEVKFVEWIASHRESAQ